MVALISLPNPFATFTTYKAYKVPRKTLIRCSIRVSASSLRRTRRKNYLRPKILKTLTKPYNIPLENPVIDPVQPVEPNVEVSLEPVTETLDSSVVEESELALGSNESGLSEVEVVREPESRKFVRFGGLSGRTVVRVVGAFVGFFILQSVVAGLMGSGDSDEKKGEDRKRSLRLRRGEGEVGLHGNGLRVGLAGLSVDELEKEAKIAEIRKMAEEVREAERRKKSENGEADLGNVSEDEEHEDDDEDMESADSRDSSGILKEVDGRLSKLKERYSVPTVNLVNKSGAPVKDGGLDAEEDNMLMYKMKHKFRSHLTTPKDKPKGFQKIDDVKEKDSKMDDETAAGSGYVASPKSDVLDSAFPEKGDDDIDKVEKLPSSQSSVPSKGLRKRSGSKRAAEKLDKGVNGSTALGSNGTAKSVSMGMSEVAKPERGLVQESSNGNILDKGVGANKSNTMANPDKKKMDTHVTSTSSETPAKSAKKVRSHPNKQGSKSLRSTHKDEKENSDPWWSKLPYVLVILMQQGIGSEAERGFYKIRMESDADNQSNLYYTVAFEDRNDAQNFSYLLESAFEDLPDATTDIAPLSKKDFKEVAESLENKVVVVRKGELKLYAGQPLGDAEAALRSLLK